MSFVLQFVHSFPEAGKLSGPCSCHDDNVVSIRLSLPGIAKDLLLKKKLKHSMFSIQRNNDICRFRKLTQNGGCLFRDEDFAFELGILM